jgi:hypothetical protein
MLNKIWFQPFNKCLTFTISFKLNITLKGKNILDKKNVIGQPYLTKLVWVAEGIQR